MSAQTVAKRDSLYIKIEKFSKQKKAAKLIYNLLFRNVSDAAAVPTTSRDNALNYNGRPIRKILITTFDPLGYSANFEKKTDKRLDDLANRLHMKTRQFTIRNYLLFKEGDAFNAQQIYESERILRDTRFINRVSIKPVEISGENDSVDVVIRALDSWSLRPMGDLSGKKLGVSLAEENVLGMGHELSGRYRINLKTKQNYMVGRYVANNLFGTYINAKLEGEKDFDDNENAYFNLNREFVSPLTRWGGGASLNYFRREITIPEPRNVPLDSLDITYVKMQNADLWAGHQFRMPATKSGEITDNIGFAARVKFNTVMEAPPPHLDRDRFFRSYNLYLASLSYTRRKFEVRKNIFRYEMPEDIPYGHSLILTGGAVQDNDGVRMPYAGISGGFGAFTKMGYFNYQLEYGTFFQGGKSHMAALRFNGTYFSPLRDFGFAYARHFVSHTFVMGQDRSASLADRINLAVPNDFPSYNRYYVGEEKLVLRYQLQLFLKHQWKNFQINPFGAATFGWLPDVGRNLFDARTELKFALGAHFYNPYLAFNRFQIALVYYPRLPFSEQGQIGMNGYRNWYFPINNFKMDAPDVINYSAYSY